MLTAQPRVPAAWLLDCQDGVPELGAGGPSSSIIDVGTFVPPPLPRPGVAGDDWDDQHPQNVHAHSLGRIPSHRWKQIYRFRSNAWGMLKRHDRGRALFVTLTLRDEGDGKPDSKDAANRLRSAEPVLDRVFAEWMLVMEFDPDSGVPHFHGIGMARQSVSASWQEQPVREVRKLRQTARRENRPLTTDEIAQVLGWSKALTPNPHLRAIWKTLRDELPAHGFGSARPANATPLENAKKALAYIVKDLERSPSANGEEDASAPASRYRKGTRLFFHNRNFQSVCSVEFSWNSPKTRLNRLRKSRIATALRVSPERCKLLFGNHWNLHMDRVIGQLNRHNRNWPAGSDTDVETGVMNALAKLPTPPDAADTTDNTLVPRWAQDLAREIWERRDRHRRGLPEDFVPEPVTTLLDDLRASHNRNLLRCPEGCG